MQFWNSHLTRNIFNLYMRRFFFGLVYTLAFLKIKSEPVHDKANNNRRSLTCAHVLLNLLNNLGKRDTMRGSTKHFIAFSQQDQ